MHRASIGASVLARIARGGSFRRSAPPEVVLAELAAIPAALARRERTTRRALAIAAVPVPLALVPLGSLLAEGLPPEALLVGVVPIGIVAVLARDAWKSRESWGLPSSARIVEALLRELPWRERRHVSVVASSGLGRERDRTIWSVEGELASGARLVASSTATRPTEEEESVRWTPPEPGRDLAARAAAVLDEIGVAVADRRTDSASIGWSRAVTRQDASSWDDTCAKIARLAEVLDAAPPASVGYRGAGVRAPEPPRRAGVELEVTPGERLAARAWSVVLTTYAVVLAVASLLAIATGRAPHAPLGAAVAGAGAAISIALAAWLASRLRREASER